MSSATLTRSSSLRCTSQREGMIDTTNRRPTTPLRSALNKASNNLKDGVNSSPRVATTGAGASPQVRAALAAMRNKNRGAIQQQQQQQSRLSETPRDISSAGEVTVGPSSSTSSTSFDALDRFSTPPRNRTSRVNHEVEGGEVQIEEFSFGRHTIALPAAASGARRNPARREKDAHQVEEEAEEAEEEVVLDWGNGARSTKDLVEGAKKTGVLTLASRELKTIPLVVYEALMSRASLHHPSRKNLQQTSRKGKEIVVDFAGSYEDQSTSWFEQRELKNLGVANNEIEDIDEMIGGFEELESLDVHNNYLTRLPMSLGHLVNLTSLNLSSNKLSTFPIQILNLVALTSLDISSNQLNHLWPIDWLDQLSDILRPPSASPSATPESPEYTARGTALGFWDSPSTRTRSKVPKSPEEDAIFARRAPFPRLTELIISENPLSADAFKSEGWTLPPRLKELHAANTGLLESAFPAQVFGRLDNLQILNFSGSEILDRLFAADIETTEDSEQMFPKLATLNLSRNQIDSLEYLEEFLLRRVKRPIEYVGVEKPILNLIRAAGPSTGTSGEPLQVVLHENPMRLEQKRRRSKLNPSVAIGTVTPSRSVSSTTTSTSATSTPRSSIGSSNNHLPQGNPVPRRNKEQWEIDAEQGLLTEGGKRRARIEAMRRAQEEEELEKAVEEAERKRAQEAMNDEDAKLNESLHGLSLNEEGVVDAELDAPPGNTPTSDPISNSNSSIDIATADPTTTTEVIESSPDDPVLQLVMDSYNPATNTVDLSNKAIESFASSVGGCAPTFASSPANLILSKNVLTLFPVESITNWGWTLALRSLDLSHNKIGSLKNLANVTLPGLTNLSLAFNALTTIEGLANFTPNLVSLDLSRNRLESDQDLQDLLFPSGGSPSFLRTLNLSGNRITTLPALLSIAESLKEVPNARSRSKGFNLTSLDLRDNDLGRLNPELGWLPLDLTVWLSGNRFRNPKREIYDSASGAKEIIGWLRDRL